MAITETPMKNFVRDCKFKLTAGKNPEAKHYVIIMATITCRGHG
jgi:hypothetical protein